MPKILTSCLNMEKNSLKLVQKLMKQLQLYSVVIKKFKPGYSYMILLTERISYILTRQKKIRFGQPIFLTRPLFGGWCYLSTIINRYAKKIIAWNLGKRMTEELLQKIWSSLSEYFLVHWSVLSRRIHQSLGYLTPN